MLSEGGRERSVGDEIVWEVRWDVKVKHFVVLVQQTQEVGRSLLHINTKENRRISKNRFSFYARDLS